jgi:hypothetical protein
LKAGEDFYKGHSRLVILTEQSAEGFSCRPDEEPAVEVASTQPEHPILVIKLVSKN